MVVRQYDAELDQLEEQIRADMVRAPFIFALAVLRTQSGLRGKEVIE